MWRKQWLSVCRTEIEKGAFMSSGESVEMLKLRAGSKDDQGNELPLVGKTSLRYRACRKQHTSKIFFFYSVAAKF